MRVPMRNEYMIGIRRIPPDELQIDRRYIDKYKHKEFSIMRKA